MATRIEWQREPRRWFERLDVADRERIAPALDALARDGTGAARKFVKKIKMPSRHELYELRSQGSNLRVLFAMDASRTAVVLTGGDKTGNGRGWYEENVKIANNRMDMRLRSFGKEALCRNMRAGTRSAARQA